jgi:hypothetical protein
MNVMAALGEITHSRHKASYRALIKSAAAFAMLAIILTGAVYFLAGAKFTNAEQVIAGLVGALLGAGSAWRSSKSNNH